MGKICYFFQNLIVIKFLKILKIREIFCENPRIIFFLFYDVHKENMFTINLEDSKARKKGAKRLEFLVIYVLLKSRNNAYFEARQIILKYLYYKSMKSLQ